MNTFDAIAWAIKVSRGEPMAARMLLIVGLAQRVGSSGEDCVVWPSLKQICADADMSRSSVKRWLKHLQERGLVEIFKSERDSGATGSNRYRLPIKAVFYHPTKGAMSDDGEGSKLDRGEGSRLDRGGVRSFGPGRGPHAGPCSELPSEQPLEDIDSTRAEESELDLGLPPIPPKEITEGMLADFIAEEWATRAHATPLRGGRLSEANAEKAMKLARANLVEGQTPIDVWREIFGKIDGSAFLQGRVAAQEGRSPFKLTLSFLLEKRNFDKTLEGRFDGQSTGNRRRGSTSEATSRVLDRVRSSSQRRPGGGNSGSLARLPSR